MADELLPAIPLYSRLRIAAARIGVCALSMLTQPANLALEYRSDSSAADSCQN
jgi:hypothetical protein